MSDYREQGVVFDCGDSRLVGIAAIPALPQDTGVLVLVGGPQYRVGSHRQFTLLSRSLAEKGIASFRFDNAGMGDSEGVRRSFHETEGDIFAAIEAFMRAVPNLSHVVLWGLCDGASTAMMYAHRFPQVSGLILLNPWVHSGEYSPAFTLAQYYRPLLSEKEHWRRLLFGGVSLGPALRDAGKWARSLLRGADEQAASQPSSQTFVRDMRNGLLRFKHEVLVILSENDLTAKEFSILTAKDQEWKRALSLNTIAVQSVSDADHTFSKRIWQDEVSRMTIDWLQS